MSNRPLCRIGTHSPGCQGVERADALTDGVESSHSYLVLRASRRPSATATGQPALFAVQLRQQFAATRRTAVDGVESPPPVPDGLLADAEPVLERRGRLREDRPLEFFRDQQARSAPVVELPAVGSGDARICPTGDDDVAFAVRTSGAAALRELGRLLRAEAEAARVGGHLGRLK